MGGAVAGGSEASCAFTPPPLGVYVTPDLRVTRVALGLAAERAGVRVGDTIAAVDGAQVQAFADAKQALDRAESRRAGPCDDTRGALLDPETNRVLAPPPPLPTPTSDGGIRVGIRREGRQLTLQVDPRWPQPRLGQPMATPLPDGDALL